MANDGGKSNATTHFRRLKAEIESLQEEGKEQLLGIIRGAIGELNAFGYSYRLVAGRRQGRRANIARPCPVCKFRTVPHHDARSHRGQGRKKRTFTSEELQVLGLVRR